MLYTTFRLVREAGACKNHYRQFAKAVGGVKAYGQDTPIPLIKILEINGLNDALWALRAVLPEEKASRDRMARLLAADFAEHVLHLYERQYPEDNQCRQAIETARQYAEGQATDTQLAAAWAAEVEWQSTQLRKALSSI